MAAQTSRFSAKKEALETLENKKLISPKTQSRILKALILLVVMFVLIFSNDIRNLLVNIPDQYKEEYQAVFLTNGQVYFGKVAYQDNDKLVLENIYYLQVNRDIQSQEAGEQQQTSPELSLIKLGNEIHGPADKMNINMDQVIFVEDLKSDSQVVKAIKK